MIRSVFFALSLTWTSLAGAGVPLFTDLDLFSSVRDYQYGSQWSRREVMPGDFQDPLLKKVIQSSLSVRSGTGLYLGKFKGQHLVATAYHVIKFYGCGDLRLQASVGSCLATLPEVDLAILKYKVSPSEEPRLKEAAANFDFGHVPVQGEPWILVGFGRAGNPNVKLQIGEDEDCRVVSKTGDIRYMDDPDQMNPNGYKTWWIANACDVSHGDSGAAFFHRQTGRPVAFVSSGTFPINKKFQDSAFLREELARNPEAAWSMNLAVPAIKIREAVAARLRAGEYPARTSEILQAWIDEQAD